MTRIAITLFFLLFSTQVGLAAGSGDSSGSGSGSGSGSYSGSMDQAQDPLAKVYKLIKTEKFDAAYKELEAVEATKKNDDVYNLMGFTARKTGRLDLAAKFYNQALEINSKHVGALQYQGELFITLGDIESAKQNLAKIGKICWLFSCEEEKLLEKAIQEALES